MVVGPGGVPVVAAGGGVEPVVDQQIVVDHSGRLEPVPHRDRPFEVDRAPVAQALGELGGGLDEQFVGDGVLVFTVERSTTVRRRTRRRGSST